MAEKKTKNLSIYLIKDKYKQPDEIVQREGCRRPIEITIDGSQQGRLFIKDTPPRPPRWANLFDDWLDINNLAIPSVAGLLILQVKGRLFAVAFGQGGRFLLRDDVYEERFGLLCALNSIAPETFRCVDIQSMDAIQSQKRVQAGQEAAPDQFGLDVEQDLLKAIVGTPSKPELGSRMTGGDALTISAKVELEDLPRLLDAYKMQFERELDSDDHAWAHNISQVKSSSLVRKLERQLDKKLAARDLNNIWLAIPEIIDWTLVRGFMFSSGGAAIHADVSMTAFLKTLKPGCTLSLEMLRNRKVFCADDDHRRVFRTWSVAKCLYAEVSYEGQQYILNDGKWFRVAPDFVARTNHAYQQIPMSSLTLPPYEGGGEGTYNASVAEAQPEQFALLDDRKKVMHGGGQGQVEICDLFSKDRHLIHVKMYGKSSVFSHLFAQGFVSGQLIQIDQEFRKKVVAKLPGSFSHLVDVARRPYEKEFKVVFAVISEEQGSSLHIPFFSRVNLNNTVKVLSGLGYEVELLKIPYDPIYAATQRLPSSDKGRPRARRRNRRSKTEVST